MRMVCCSGRGQPGRVLLLHKGSTGHLEGNRPTAHKARAAGGFCPATTAACYAVLCCPVLRHAAEASVLVRVPPQEVRRAVTRGCTPVCAVQRVSNSPNSQLRQCQGAQLCAPAKVCVCADGDGALDCAAHNLLVLVPGHVHTQQMHEL